MGYKSGLKNKKAASTEAAFRFFTLHEQIGSWGYFAGGAERILRRAQRKGPTGGWVE